MSTFQRSGTKSVYVVEGVLTRAADGVNVVKTKDAPSAAKV
jgi:hypothetical protein